MIVLQPLYVGADRGRAGFDAAVIALDNRVGRGDLAVGVVEIANDIIMQRALVALQRQDLVAPLIDDLLGDFARQYVGAAARPETDQNAHRPARKGLLDVRSAGCQGCAPQGDRCDDIAHDLPIARDWCPLVPRFIYPLYGPLCQYRCRTPLHGCTATCRQFRLDPSRSRTYATRLQRTSTEAIE